MTTEIINENFKKQIIFLLNNNWTGKNDMYFPLQNAINIERKHIFKLFNYKYIFYTKDTVNTKRAVLFLFKNSSGENTSVIIFKDLSIYQVQLNTLDEYFDGSIFEISYTDTCITVYDAFMISGNKINYQPFEERISDVEIMTTNSNIIDFTFKMLYYSKDINDFKNLAQYEELFMLPVHLPILTGINFSFLKWKPVEKITFCLQIAEENDDLILLSSNFKKLVNFAKINNNASNGNEYIKQIKDLENYDSNCIIELNLKFPEGKILIERVNMDKIYPTSVRLIEKVLFIKNENIKFEELYK
tara:strand:- start:2517 stop:3422 length:906 start_codon:yes stop_codon:yes gene_type:complete